MNIVYSLGIFLATFVIHNALGIAADRNPALMGGPLIDGNTNSRIIYAVGGGASLLALFWNKIIPYVWRFLGSGGTPPSDPTSPITDIIGIIQAILGSDARLAVLKPILNFLLSIPQVIDIVKALMTGGWPDYFYVVVSVKGVVYPAAAGALPAKLPMPPEPPTPIILPAPPAAKTEPPQVLNVATAEVKL